MKNCSVLYRDLWRNLMCMKKYSVGYIIHWKKNIDKRSCDTSNKGK
jgi:hypothetical protein